MTERSLYALPDRAFTLLLAAMLVCVAVAARAQSPGPVPCAACIVLSITPGQSVLIGPSLEGLEVLVRADPAAAADVRAAVEAVRQAGGRPGLWLPGPAVTIDPALAALAHRIVIDLSNDAADPGELSFLLKTRAVELRSAAPQLLIGVRADPGQFALLLARDLGAYVDFHAAASTDRPAFPRTVAMVPGTVAIGEAGGGLQRPGSARRWIVPLPADVVAAEALLTDVRRSAPLVPDGLVAGGMSDVRCGTARLPTYLDPDSLATIAIGDACRTALVVQPERPGVQQERLSAGEVVVRVPPAEGRFAEGVRVTGARTLTVREIIARHQAAAARQRRAVRQLISSGTMTLTFEAPGFPAPMAITSQATIYTAADAVDIEQRDVRVNGIAFPGGQVPRLPLLEPERVASAPLAISLSDVYTYSLEGREEIDGVACYVVSFAPVDRKRSLFAGTVWIAQDTFGMVKVSAVQTALRGPIVSSEQTDEFQSAQGGLWLLGRSEIRQLYEGPGHRTPIHRVLVLDRQEVNPESFAERRAQAYASPHIMLRDTPEGFRYLKRERTDPEAASTATADPVTPVLTPPSQRVRTVAFGVIIDPNISTPLPFAGLSYIDFNLFGTGTQMNGFFGGTYGQLAMSVPSLGGSRWQLAGRAFAIASSYNDRAFVNGREHYEWNISQRPAHASAWVLRPLSSRLSLRAGYELDYTGFDRASSTASSFAVPVSQVAHGIRVAMDGQWAGWTSSVWWSGARRAGWQAWGEVEEHDGLVGVGEYDPRHRDYQRFGALLARSIVASPRLVGRIEGSWMTGRDLDRFSRYTFGSFDNRLRGYPSALIRYDRGVVVRGSAAWSAGRFVRLDGFLDSAYVHDPAFGRGGRSYTGVGTALEAPAPFGTLLAIEWGYGFQGIDTDGRKGTQVFRISGYKIF
jgi:hypothetical protein